ncbi:hypothetical protein N7532_005978 [Penicillium argentinense]|uniref:Mid2 domain-containing protein n=1 Tax=Penicillium argentinense TaxID=1131581 RepID=A0A9W9FFE1_9EURO|nr:uncharacterized protein N7532_005978 [Penicillium argentinense]KAJ5098977.1 hypothetical protein N7532_005978 [Penicillium argentinense]
MRPSSFLSLPLYLACLPSVSAWVFSWHNPTGKLLTVQGDKRQDCQVMDNPTGNVYDWNPQEGHWCIFLYTNSDCEEPSAGYTCKPWPWVDHPSSQHLQSFKVVNDTSSYASSASASASATDANASPTSTTATTPTSDASASSAAASASASASSASDTSDKEATPSGGAIAGIVVGVVAAVAIAGILIFFLWRRRKTAAKSNAALQTDSTTGVAEMSNPDEEKSPISDKPISRGQDSRELQGSGAVSELSPTSERYEMGAERLVPMIVRHELDATQFVPDKKE